MRYQNHIPIFDPRVDVVALESGVRKELRDAGFVQIFNGRIKSLEYWFLLEQKDYFLSCPEQQEGDIALSRFKGEFSGELVVVDISTGVSIPESEAPDARRTVLIFRVISSSRERVRSICGMIGRVVKQDESGD